MHKINVNGHERIAQAITWCKESISNHWDLDSQWPRDSCTFIFNSKQDASWFGLHWAH